MAVTGLTGYLGDDALLAAISAAEFGDPAVLDPTAYQVNDFIVGDDPDAPGERRVQYNISSK